MAIALGYVNGFFFKWSFWKLALGGGGWRGWLERGWGRVGRDWGVIGEGLGMGVGEGVAEGLGKGWGGVGEGFGEGSERGWASATPFEKPH